MNSITTPLHTKLPVNSTNIANKEVLTPNNSINKHNNCETNKLSTSTPNSQVNLFTQKTRQQVLGAVHSFNGNCNMNNSANLELKQFKFKIPDHNNNSLKHNNELHELNFNEQANDIYNNNDQTYTTPLENSRSNDSGVGSNRNGILGSKDMINVDRNFF
jgi:hypothetical protein